MVVRLDRLVLAGDQERQLIASYCSLWWFASTDLFLQPAKNDNPYQTVVNACWWIDSTNFVLQPAMNDNSQANCIHYELLLMVFCVLKSVPFSIQEQLSFVFNLFRRSGHPYYYTTETHVCRGIMNWYIENYLAVNMYTQWCNFMFY